jgi:fructose transport system ATP-binding protein
MSTISENASRPILKARGLVKRYGRVTALDNADFDLYPGEILAVIGDNGAGKSSLIKALSGAVTIDDGEMELDGKPMRFSSPMQAREAGIETVYQTLALSPALSIADNMFLGREIRKPGPLGSIFKMLDRNAMERIAREKLSDLGLMTIQNIAQPVETLSGGQRQGVAVARAAAFGSKVIIMDEPTAALGVQETAQVENIIRTLKENGEPLILVSHNMRQVFDLVDRIVVFRRGRIVANLRKQDTDGNDIVAYITGAKTGEAELRAA